MVVVAVVVDEVVAEATVEDVVVAAVTEVVVDTAVAVAVDAGNCPLVSASSAPIDSASHRIALCFSACGPLYTSSSLILILWTRSSSPLFRFSPPAYIPSLPNPLEVHFVYSLFILHCFIAGLGNGFDCKYRRDRY